MANYLDRDNYGMYQGTDQGPGPRLMGADTLLNNDVVNEQGDDLGDIKEIMIDMQDGHVAYAVLAFGGFWGIGEKLFAVPWQALQLDTENQRFTLDVPRDKLQNAPGFDKDRWPDMTDVTWQEQIHEFYGTQPYSAHTGGAGMSGGISGGRAGLGTGAGTAGAGGGLGAGHAGSSTYGPDSDLTEPGSGSISQSTYRERE